MMSMKPTVVNADTEKMQRLFNEYTDASIEKYEGEQWKLYYQGFSDGMKVFSESIKGIDLVKQRIIGQ